MEYNCLSQPQSENASHVLACETLFMERSTQSLNELINYSGICIAAPGKASGCAI